MARIYIAILIENIRGLKIPKKTEVIFTKNLLNSETTTIWHKILRVENFDKLWLGKYFDE